MSRLYYEPILQPISTLADPLRFQNTQLGFEFIRIHERGHEPQVLNIMDCDEDAFEIFTETSAMFQNEVRKVMGIVNVTPDSFSDGGEFNNAESSVRHAQKLVQDGANILDFGAESTRPGAAEVTVQEELMRLEGALEMMDSFGVPCSVDTRKSIVADEAIGAGASMINDVSAGTFDPVILDIIAQSGVQVCLMHSLENPETMQDDPSYDNVLLDIYDYLEERIEVAETLGIERHQIILDPGIGFGKTLEHNLTILKHISLFHGLGCPLLVGASRKSMIGAISPSEANERIGGSISIALDLARKGVHFIRVHDVRETVQALKIQDRLMEE